MGSGACPAFAGSQMNPADLIERLREFAQATCATVTAENGEQLTFEDSVIWLAADTLAANVKALAEIGAENERLKKALEEATEIIGAFAPLTDDGSRSRRFLASRSLGLLDGEVDRG